MTRAVSRTGSPRPICVVAEERNRAWPPSWYIPTSKDTRVRVELFSNSMPRVLPASRAWGSPCFCCRLRSRVRAKMRSSPERDQSLSFRKSIFIESLLQTFSHQSGSWLVRRVFLQTPDRSIEVILVQFHAEKAPVEHPGGNSGRADAHKGVEHQVSRVAGDADQVFEQPYRLLGRMFRLPEAFRRHADRAFEKIVHGVLPAEVPGVLAVPHTDNQLATVQKTLFADLRDRIGLVPDKELKGVENRVEDLMPAAQQVVGAEGEQIAGRFQNAQELIADVTRVEVTVPFRQVIVDFPAPVEPHIASGILAQIIRRVG